MDRPSLKLEYKKYRPKQPQNNIYKSRGLFYLAPESMHTFFVTLHKSAFRTRFLVNVSQQSPVLDPKTGSERTLRKNNPTQVTKISLSGWLALAGLALAGLALAGLALAGLALAGLALADLALAGWPWLAGPGWLALAGWPWLALAGWPCPPLEPNMPS